MPKISGQGIRQAMLEVISRCSRQRMMQSRQVLDGTLTELSIPRGNVDLQQAVLTVYSDMFRIGLLAWGGDFANNSPPFCHVTERGRKTLQNLSRDPANPDGYLNQTQLANINEISRSYIKEAVRTYNSDCHKASAVMVGAASEALILEFRDKIAGSTISLTDANRRKLKDWRIKTVLTEIGKILEHEKKNMQSALAERYEAYWPAFTQQIRATRNEAGHPSSIEPVTFETVHASLLIFPELAQLVNDMMSWLESYNANTQE